MTQLKLEQFGKAEEAARASLRIREQVIPDHWLRYNAMSLLGGALLGQERFAEAEPLLIEGYQGMAAREKSGADKKRMIQALRRIVELYEAWGQPDKSQFWKEKLSAEDVDPARNSPP